MPTGTPLTIEERQERIDNLIPLLEEHISEVIDSNLDLLQRIPIATVNAAYSKLISFGIKPEKIASCVILLSWDSDTLQRNFDFLNQKLGISREKIASCAALLGRDPNILQRNWEHRRRYFNADEIRNHPGLLGLRQDNIDSNAQFLCSYNIGTAKPRLYDTKQQTKYEKMIWMARNVFNSHILEGYERVEAVSKVRKLVSMHPSLTLTSSINALEKNIGTLRSMAQRIN